MKKLDEQVLVDVCLAIVVFSMLASGVIIACRWLFG